MSSNNFESYNNYIDVANLYNHDSYLYFYIKNYCFRKMIDLAKKDPNRFYPKESSILQNDLKIFKEESKNKNFTPLTKKVFSDFLEKFYSQFNFDLNEDIKTFKKCKDITEILNIFGPLDDIFLKRSKYI